MSSSRLPLERFTKSPSTVSIRLRSRLVQLCRNSSCVHVKFLTKRTTSPAKLASPQKINRTKESRTQPQNRKPQHPHYNDTESIAK